MRMKLETANYSHIRVFGLGGLGEYEPQDKAADCILQACVSTPDDCKVEITPEYLEKIVKYVKKQEKWNRRLRRQLKELTSVPVDSEAGKCDEYSIIDYRRSLERENKAFAKQIKKLKNIPSAPST